MISGIYCFKCLKNGKVYVGQSIDTEGRKKSHINELNGQKKKGKWQSEWNKWGSEAFEFSILAVVVLDPKYETETEEMKKKLLGWALDTAEKKWISTLHATDKKKGYNKAPGGNYMPPQVKRKWQKKMKNKRKIST
jgi:group I intron endonuclease